MPDIPLDRIEYAFAEDFFDYMTLTECIQDNTAIKYLKNTKQLLKLAVQRKWLTYDPLGDFVCTYINPDRDILDMDELSALYHKEFTIPRLQETKDAYLFMALTGYAYKDALMLSPDNVAKFLRRRLDC
ncbi:hypothetical protein CLV51_1102 [Chitinophaga niastensis]|uniref:Phage integrase SAM-like domain-containing protein n=2 Tax=Chitinophaga niastensis TaxID=536980 RepID=A0A2P8H976_CHINA|nr:phage integrase SAM-like domain-containing protein [Chitinophaga niastensis]PSL42786.1 hypothetical protein CLV51_1102 [Chitinophaga niastensis]